LQSVVRADPEPVGTDDLGDLGDRPGCFEAEIAYDDVGFVDQDARALFELREADARIDVAVIIGAADHDVRGVLRRVVEIGADAIGRRGDLLNHFLQLFDHLARLADCFLLRLNLRTHDVELAPMPILRWDRGNEEIERFEETELLLARAIIRVFEFFTALVVHAGELLDYKPGEGCRKLEGRVRARPRRRGAPRPIFRYGLPTAEKEVEGAEGAT
jgi:hypothetical protein